MGHACLGKLDHRPEHPDRYQYSRAHHSALGRRGYDYRIEERRDRLPQDDMHDVGFLDEQEMGKHRPGDQSCACKVGRRSENHVLVEGPGTSSGKDSDKCFVMDLENGNTKPLEEDGLSMPEALGDGWFAFGETSRTAISHSAKTVLYDFDGTPKETFDFNKDRQPPAARGPPRPSLSIRQANGSRMGTPRGLRSCTPCQARSHVKPSW